VARGFHIAPEALGAPHVFFVVFLTLLFLRQVDLELEILLCQSPKCWYYRCVLPHPVLCTLPCAAGALLLTAVGLQPKERRVCLCRAPVTGLYEADRAATVQPFPVLIGTCSGNAMHPCKVSRCYALNVCLSPQFSAQCNMCIF
jgi:hypothetical protein